MNSTLTHFEYDIAAEIINIGLSKAADSLSFFTKEKVLIRSMDLQLMEIGEDDIIQKDGASITVLASQLKGKIQGACFLIFTEEESEQLASLTLPEKVKDDPIKVAEMKKAILTEVDNIITAAVVTQFANLLRTNVHADVPMYHNGTKASGEQYIREIVKKEAYGIHFTAVLMSQGLKVCPEFFWCIDNAFVDSVKTLVQNDQNLARYKELTDAKDL